MRDPEIVRLEPQPTAAIRVSQPMARLDLASAFDRGIPLVAERVVAAGGSLVGPPYGRYHAFGPDVVDVEIGFPVGAVPDLPLLADCAPGDVGRSELPGGPVARAVHFGSYDGLSGTYDVLHEWIHAQPGYDDGAGPWESYVDDPRSVGDPEKVRTEISWPLDRE
ncbi:MAG TPA: GyrI-like domain-containing protein [Candidatus Limnocylindrales bacterium]|nr:GyrI-like domain-containing protein [Candidatus Limnocylindrales bacterium]